MVAAATGSGAAGGANITVTTLRVDAAAGSVAVVSRRQVASGGGWPTFWRNATSGEEHVVFHRLMGPNIEGPWDIVSVGLASGVERTVVPGGMTPSVDGDELAFTFLDLAGHRQVGLINVATGVQTQVTKAPTHHYNPTVVAARGGGTPRVFFHKCRCGARMGRVRARRSAEPGFSSLGYVVGDFPALSPDGRSVAWIGVLNELQETMFQNVNVLDISGGTAKSAGANRIAYTGDAWQTSWHGDTIAFSVGPAFAQANNGNARVGVVNAATGVARNVTPVDPTHNNAYPSFAPDGRRLVFRTSATQAQRVAPAGGKAQPQWTPSPHTPAWNGSYPYGYHLAVIAADGQSPAEQLTAPVEGVPLAIGDTHPAWGPDGTVVFASDRGHTQRLTVWAVDGDGSNLREVFDGGATNVHPTTYVDASNETRLVFTSTLAGFSMEEISWPFGFVFEAEVFTCPLANCTTATLRRLTHDAGENANVHVSTAHDLPTDVATATRGPPMDCKYHDSTLVQDPFDLASLRTAQAHHRRLAAQREAKRSQSPPQRDAEDEADEADPQSLKRFFPHGMVGDERRAKGGRCPFFRGRK